MGLFVRTIIWTIIIICLINIWCLLLGIWWPYSCNVVAMISLRFFRVVQDVSAYNPVRRYNAFRVQIIQRFWFSKNSLSTNECKVTTHVFSCKNYLSRCDAFRWNDWLTAPCLVLENILRSLVRWWIMMITVNRLVVVMNDV